LLTEKEELNQFDVKQIEMFQAFGQRILFKELTLIWYIHFFLKTTVSINHLLSIANKLYTKHATSIEFYFERINVLYQLQRWHMKQGDMNEIYLCRTYFQSFKDVIQ
jgi:hypothetical protein